MLPNTKPRVSKSSALAASTNRGRAFRIRIGVQQKGCECDRHYNNAAITILRKVLNDGCDRQRGSMEEIY